MKKATKVLAVIASAALCATTLGGCGLFSKASKTTCEEFGKTYDEKGSDIIMRMIEEHGFDSTSSVMGTVAIASEVVGYCGYVPGVGSERNLDQPIENGVDWGTVGSKN